VTAVKLVADDLATAEKSDQGCEQRGLIKCDYCVGVTASTTNSTAAAAAAAVLCAQLFAML
jgi:hypothetical protein